MAFKGSVLAFAASVAALPAAAAVDVRIIDAAGSPSSVGTVQVRTGTEATSAFGSVCGLNLAAADVVCRQLGYDFGSVSSSPCSSYGGSNVCAPAGASVAMMNLACAGGELDLAECSWATPDASCDAHERDSVVYCGFHDAPIWQDGSLRLIAADGAPSITGTGRLEVFKAGSWAPVCRDGFNAGAEAVSCKAMGFSGVQASSAGRSCKTVGGEDICGSVSPFVSEVACNGQEGSLLECSFKEGDDVFCATEESVIVSCAGSGDAAGKPSKLPVPVLA